MEEKSDKCNQCNFASYQTGNLRTHLKMHIGEKSNKCNQCDYASSYASTLRAHLKNQWRKVKQNLFKKCNQCDYTSSQAGQCLTSQEPLPFPNNLSEIIGLQENEGCGTDLA